MKRILLLACAIFILPALQLHAQKVLINYCTPLGDSVNHVYKVLDELTPYEIHKTDSIFRRDNPYYTIIAPSSRKYNCHGYAFSVADGNDTLAIGINTDSVDAAFYLDEIYRLVDESTLNEILNTLSSPAKVRYTVVNQNAIQPNHSAIVANHIDTFISKNGESPLFKHPARCELPGANWLSSSIHTYKYYVKATDLVTGPTEMTCQATFNLNQNIQGEIHWEVEPAELFQNPEGSGNTAALTFKQGIAEQTANAKITFFYKRSGCDNTNSVALPFTAVVPSQDKVDLYIKDTPNDMGIEPNQVSEWLWISDDIWVRNRPDGYTNQITENPEYDPNNPVYVYVRVRNKSCTAFEEGGKLHLYWAKAGVSLNWPNSWNGSITNPALMGNQIGTLNIPAIAPGGETILRFEWNIPNPEQYTTVNEPWHFCLLARIESELDPMTYAEYSGLGNNVQNNNNIAWKNMTIVDNATQSKAPGGKIWLMNTSIDKDFFRLYLKVPDQEIEESILKEAEVTVKLSEKLYYAWKDGGAKGKGIKDMDKYTILITEPNAYLDNLMLYPDEVHTAYLGFNFLTQQISKKPSFNYIVEFGQKKEDEKYKLIGGELYEIYKWERNLFKADAGDDKVVFKNSNVLLQAQSVSEAATYNWYNMNDSLVFTGTNYTTTASQTQKYKLEIISEADGYKDYDEVTVNVKEFAIKKLLPNPVRTNLTVEYDAEYAASAYIHVYNANGILVRTLPLNPQTNTITFSVANYQTGSYSVTLVCNGQISDSKTFIVH